MWQWLYITVYLAALCKRIRQAELLEPFCFFWFFFFFCLLFWRFFMYGSVVRHTWIIVWIYSVISARMDLLFWQYKGLMIHDSALFIWWLVGLHPSQRKPVSLSYWGEDSLIQLTCCRDRRATEPTDPNRQQTSTASLSSSTFSLLCLFPFRALHSFPAK
jgi:hypothetical protein